LNAAASVQAASAQTASMRIKHAASLPNETLFIFDEPTSNLDVERKSALAESLNYMLNGFSTCDRQLSIYINVLPSIDILVFGYNLHFL
jgi:ABC-type cobalamin transport system ATPase subunit